MTTTDFDNYFLLLVVAGNETTRHTISQAMLALIEIKISCEFFSKARADPVATGSSSAGPRQSLSGGPPPDVDCGKQIKKDKVVM
jgi:hypothetical protein